MTALSTGDTGFWNRPATWKPQVLVLGYLAFYLAVGWVVSQLLGDQVDDDNIVGSASSIVVGLALPIAIGAAALLVFTARVGWLGEIFGPQPVAGRGWMWIAPLIVAGAIVAHLAGTDWDRWTAREIAAMALLGACVGLAEELATRGLVVKMLRDAGHAEQFVAVVSSLLFALMHMVNLLQGMAVTTVAATVVYTFGFGMCMYLTMRVTGTIWAAIVLHGLTDPTTFLSTGGLDTAVGDQNSGAMAVVGLTTTALVVFAVVAAFLVRGRVDRPTDAPLAS